MGGHPSDLDRLKEIAARHKIALVEDSSHAHGSEWRGQRIGTFGVAGTFSFQSSKLMTADEGGIIILNDDNFERQARSVHDCGRMPGEWFYSHFIYGFNYRLSEWQGAVLTAQLGRLDERTRRRHQNATPSRPRTQQNPRAHAAKARRALHTKWTVRLHFPRGPQAIRRYLDRALYRGHERGEDSEPGKLSTIARVAHVPQCGVSQVPEWSLG
jgi:dTDP-4-amino-4,6-dideoxygalactose transaminase